MRSEYKTAIMMVAMIGGMVGIIGMVLQQYETESFEPGTIRTEEGIRLADIDKSGLKRSPGIVGVEQYINTTPEELEELTKDGVVMYDIWTYSCINCVRTLPYITAWDEKYSDQGLVIIGVHTPEFEFEKDTRNVETAVAKHGIEYPVVLDNDWETWNAFENRYWPRKYIADHEGYIRYDHIGEGGYAETEKVIQQLLEERAVSLGLDVAEAASLVDLEEFEHTRYRTPELYFGYELAFGRSQLGNQQGFAPNEQVRYAIPSDTEQHKFYMQGTWQNNADHMKLISGGGEILLPYVAKQVNIVASGQGKLQVLLGGEPVPDRLAGGDIEDGWLSVDGPGLYNLIEGEASEAHDIHIIVGEPGFEMYTFTFG